jgi:hypothetical protein
MDRLPITPTNRPDAMYRLPTVEARSVTGLRAIVRRTRGWTCNVPGVALDDQAGALHLPLLDRADRRSPAGRVATGELIVRRVEEFVVEGAALRRSFELDDVTWDPATRGVSIGSGGRSQFALTVEALDVTLRIRPPTRP